MTRLDLVRASARRMDRAAGRPVNLTQAEVIAVRRALLAGEMPEVLAQRYSCSVGRIKRCAKATALVSSQSLLIEQREMRERRARWGRG